MKNKASIAKDEYVWWTTIGGPCFGDGTWTFLYGKTKELLWIWAINQC